VKSVAAFNGHFFHHLLLKVQFKDERSSVWGAGLANGIAHVCGGALYQTFGKNAFRDQE
jgi:hypothetical protein